MSYSAQVIFFRKPDGTPWVKFYERGHPSLSPVIEVGKMVTVDRSTRADWGRAGLHSMAAYTVWPDGDNHLRGAIGSHH